MLIFGFAWLAFSMVFFVLFLGPLFQERKFISYQRCTDCCRTGNLKPILLPGAIIGVFVLIGLILVYAGFRMLFKKGGYLCGHSKKTNKHGKG
jgi:hypothetical protein